MSHASVTTMGRHFTAERGRAVAFALTGHVAGGMLLPPLAAGLLAVLAWRSIWLGASLALVLVTAPLVWMLLTRAGVGQPQSPGEAAGQSTVEGNGGAAASGSAGAAAHDRAASEQSAMRPRDWTVGEVVRERGLYVRLCVLLAPAFITTGLIFHQVHLGAQKGWGLSVIASALSVYALGAFVMTLAGGYLVDRFSARRCLPFALLPMAAACFLLTSVSSPAGAFGFFTLLGFGTGLSHVLGGAIWAELYGITHLGSIRAFAASGSVFSSGLAPGAMGVLIDWGWQVDGLGLACGLYCVVASALAAFFIEPPVRPHGPGVAGAR